MTTTVRRIVEFLWPELVLEGTEWHGEWTRGRKERFAKTMQIFFLLAAVAYIAHYFFVDIPNNKQPIEAWLTFRVVVASLCVLGFLFYRSSLAFANFSIWPAVILLAIGCHAQAHVTYFYPETPWFFAFFLVLAGTLLLQTSALNSLLFAVPVMVSYFPPLLNAGVPAYQLASATGVSILVLAVVRSSYAIEINTFLLSQQQDQARREIINLGREYQARLKSFIPRVISDRIQRKIDEERMSVLEASVDVLKARKQAVSCLWSDIRGFTEGSRNVDSFLMDSVIPEVKACSDAVELYDGIPRKIGDLIFAYFDDDSPEVNLLRSLLAGFELAILNEDMNATVSAEQIRRYILISSGEAIVGNVGGLNSGVEITALGPPVNFLARLDDATKSPGLARELEAGDLILCEHSRSILAEMGLSDCLKQVDLKAADVVIKDFPEVKQVFVLRPRSTNHELIRNAFLKISTDG